MSASSTQHTVEMKEAVKDVKPTKPPVKPKPIVPPKPKQAFISSNSENKSPLLSPGPCSPTTDIPSAFKISQLTGPQPYGTRRTSLRRWSSSVGEEVSPEGNTLLSPVENVVPELFSKVTTQPLAAAAKHLQTGSVWKGKSPFMLTTRGWGEQKYQAKDIHERESFPQKPNVISASKDVDLKEMALEGNAVLNSSGPPRSISSADHKEVHTNVQDLKQSFSRLPEEVKKTPLEDPSSGKLKKNDIPAKDNEGTKSQESSKLSISPQTDAYFGMTKQSTQCERNMSDTKTGDLSDRSGQETTGGPQGNDGASVQRKNTSLSPKDIEGPQLIPPVPTPRQRANILVKENTKTIEESPSSEPPSTTAHEVYKYHEDRSDDIPELRPEITEGKDADTAYLQTLPSQKRVVNQNKEQGILGKLEKGEEHAISSMTQITDKPLTTIDDKERTVSTEHNLLYTDEHYDLHETQVPSDNHNKPYQEDKKIVAPTDMQSPSSTVRSNEIYSKGQETTSTQVHDYNIEEEQDQPKNRQHACDDTIQHWPKKRQHEYDYTVEDQPKNRQHKYDDTVEDQSKNSQQEHDDTVWDQTKNGQHEYDDTVWDQSKNSQHEYDDTMRDQSKNRQQEYDDTIQDPSKNCQQEYDDTIQDPSKNCQHEYDDTILEPAKYRQHEYDHTILEPAKYRQHEYDDTIRDSSKNRLHEYDDTIQDPSKNCQHEYDDTIWDPSKNRQHEYDDTILEPSKYRQHEYDDTIQDPSKNRQHEYDDTILDPSKNRQHEYDDTIQDQSKNRQHEYDDTILDPSKNRQHEYDDTILEPSKYRQHEYDDTILDPSKNRQHECDDTILEPSKYRQHEYDDTIRDPSKNRQHEYDDTIQDQSKNRQHEYDDTILDPSKNRQHEYDDTIQDQSKNRQHEYDDTILDPSKNRQHEYDDTILEPSKNRQHEYDDTIRDPSKNRQHEYDDTIQTVGYVPYQTSEVSEKHTEYPSEYRSFFENNEGSHYYSKTPSAPELPGPTDTETLINLHVGSQILKSHNLIPGDLYSYSVDESKEPSHSMERDAQPRKPHEDLNPLQSYGSSRPELSYDESQFRYLETTSQDPVAGMSQQDELSDHYEQSDRQQERNEVHSKKIEFRADELHTPQYGHSQSQEQEISDAHKVELNDNKSDELVHIFEQSEEPDYKYQELKKSVHKYEQTDKSTVKHEQVEKSDQISEPSKEPEYTYEQSQEPMSRYQQCWGSDLKYEQIDKSTLKDEHLEESDHSSESSKEREYTYKQSQEPMSRYQQPWGSDPKYEQTDKSTVKYEKLEESDHRSETSKEREYTYEQSQEPMSRYQQSWGSDLKYEQIDKSTVKYEQLEDSDQRSEPSEETEYTYEQSHGPMSQWGSDHKYDQTEELGNRHEKLEHSIHKNEFLEQQPYGREKSEDAVHKNDQSEESVHVSSSRDQNLSANKYKSPEESEHRYAYFEEKVHTLEELEYPVHKFEQFDEPSEYEQTTKPIQGYQKPVYRFKEPEEIIHDQPQELDYRYVQHDEPDHCDELVNQRECTEDPTYVHTGSDAKNSQLGLMDLESLQHQYKPVQSEEMDSTPYISTVSCDVDVKHPEKHIRSSEHLGYSHNEEPKCSDSSTEEIHDSKKTLEEQVHKYALPEDQQIQGVREEGTQQSLSESEEDQLVDGLTEGSRQGSPAVKTDDSKPEGIQDQEAKTYQILNGHAEHSVDFTSDVVKEINTEEPEETQAEEPHVENFDFLDGTVVLDSSFMRGKASLGKKRGHRIPVGTSDTEENDPEYWMFRDSTEPKIISEKQSDIDEKERQVDEDEKDEASPSQSPVKSPHRKGIFAGIISPSLLKGRLKTRSKTMEDETVRPEAEESKSPGKEKPESPSHSLNWLQALKKKRKSTKESTKEDKKKQPK